MEIPYAIVCARLFAVMTRQKAHPLTVWWLPAVVVYALVAARYRPLTTPAEIAALVPGIALLVVRLTRKPGPLLEGAAPDRAGVQWLGLLGLGAVWELVAALWGNDSAHPTFSLILSPAFEHYYWVRVVGYVCWLALGRWLVIQ